MHSTQPEPTTDEARGLQIAGTVKSYIVDNFLFGKGGENLSTETSLMEAGVIDSTGILELVSFLEETWEFQVDDEDLVPENLDSIDNVTAYIVRKIQ